MRFFVTGSTGFVGAHVVDNLLAHGHSVVGLTRYEETAAQLKAKGAEPLLGSIEDLALLKRAAADADAVLHLAFNRDFSKYAESCANDRAAIEALGDALVAAGAASDGGRRALVVTSGTLLLESGDRIDEDSEVTLENPMAKLRGPSEPLARGYAHKGLRVAIVRLAPAVHGGDGRAGFAGMLAIFSLQQGFVPQIGDAGTNSWNACNVLDAANLYRLAGEKGGASPDGDAYHAVGESSVLFRDIAAATCRELALSIKVLDAATAAQIFGWFANGLGIDRVVYSDKTQAALGWKPVNKGLIDDMPLIAAYAKAQAASNAN